MDDEAAAWEAVRGGLEEARAAVDEAFSALLDDMTGNLYDLLAGVAAAEQRRCLAWAESGRPLTEVADAIREGLKAPRAAGNTPEKEPPR